MLWLLPTIGPVELRKKIPNPTFHAAERLQLNVMLPVLERGEYDESHC